jgi:hypothetical protein
MFKFLIKLLEDETGKFDWMWGDSSIKDAVLGKGEEVYDPLAELRDKYKTYLGNKLGTSTPYSYNDAFTLDQPAIEKQTEGVISQGLGNLPQKRTDIFDINQKYGAARKAQLGLQQEEDVKKQKDMYNRLGLVSSTPGLQAETDLRYKQGLDKNVIDAEVAQQGIGQEMDAEKLYQDVANQYMNQGQVLGANQRGYQEYGIDKSMQDIIRKVTEEQGYAGMTGSLLGQQQPDRSYDAGILGQLTKSGSEMLPYLLMMSMMA